jgi:demethylmenaquinone methyltransferase / 2-methoxy-6-polyprenyl-1,4-benzoquinol methylase
MSDDKNTASFGFRDVPEDEKSRLVGKVFSSVAKNYDAMNDLMSGGVHRLWKQAMIDWLAPGADTQLLDVAGGTGDIAFRFLDRATPKKGAARAVICDINADMLNVGAERAAARADRERTAFVCGNAEALPFTSASADAYTIAFGIRNVTHIDRALSEAYRTLRPGGRFLCLEFSRVDVPILEQLYELWSFKAIPAIGEAVSRDRAAYEYLVESIRRFPPQAAFAKMIEQAGFARVTFRNLTGGIAAMHSGWKI